MQAIAGCRVQGRDSSDPICSADGSVPRFKIGSMFCPAPERTTILVHLPIREKLAGGWIRVRWDKMGFSIHLLVNPDAWRIPAFSLTDENGEGAAHLSALLYSALDEYAVGEIPPPRAVAGITDAAYSTIGGHRQGLDRWVTGPEEKHSPEKA